MGWAVWVVDGVVAASGCSTCSCWRGHPWTPAGLAEERRVLAAGLTDGQRASCHLLEGHTWTRWYWCDLLMTFSARMLKQ